MESWSCRKFKGQLGLTEFLLVSFVLVGLLAASIGFWNYGNEKIRENVERTDFETAAISVSDQIIKSPGLPLDWHENVNRTVSIGLVDHDRKLNQAKIDKFVNMSYGELRDYLGIENYQFRFRISSLENSLKFEGGVAPADPDIVVNARRVAVLGNEIVYVDVTLWQ